MGVSIVNGLCGFRVRYLDPSPRAVHRVGAQTAAMKIGHLVREAIFICHRTSDASEGGWQIFTDIDA